jgi:IclR family transcriptional regulator, pca regulon regulatory protein
MPGKDRELIAGLAKGLGIIEAFETSRASLTVSEAAELAGLSRAAARRCLRTLQLLGHVEAENNKFKLTPRVLRLARAYVASTPLPRVVQPIIEAMSQQLHHSMTVAVLDDIYVTIIARTLVHSTLSGGMALGTRLPAYCSANGRALLSDLPEPKVKAFLQRLELQKLTPYTKTNVAEIMKELRTTRSEGYAINDQEVELGLRSIALPVRSRHGAIICSVSMSARADASDRNFLLKMLPELEAARRRISTAL